MNGGDILSLTDGHNKHLQINVDSLHIMSNRVDQLWTLIYSLDQFWLLNDSVDQLWTLNDIVDQPVDPE